MLADTTGSPGTLLTRFAVYLAFWIIVSDSGSPVDVLVGCLAAAAAAWTSLRLMPPAGHMPSTVGIARLAWKIVSGSVRAGLDVGLRALRPEPRLRPGFVAYRTGLPEGDARSLYLTVASLLPGTLPAAVTEDGTVSVHCLDTEMPVAADMAADEAALCRALGHEAAHG